MQPWVMLVVAMVAGLAAKRRNGPDEDGSWRLVAAAAGGLFPSLEFLFWFLGPGSYYQAKHALLWALPLLPLYAFFVAGFLSVVLRQPWARLWYPAAAGMLAAMLMGMLTEEGTFPLALLAQIRIAGALLHPADPWVCGITLVGLAVAVSLPAFNRDMARLTLGCVAAYVALCGVLNWQARDLGGTYARALELGPVEVRAMPGALSPFNWDVLVTEGNGKMHVASVTLRGRAGGYAAAGEGRYRPLHEATWQVHDRFGGLGTAAAVQRRARLAWYAWQTTPFGWLGRTSAFLSLMPAPGGDRGASCVRFGDIVRDPRDPAGIWVVCPGQLPGRPRIYRPVKDGLRELIPVFLVRA